MPSRFHLEPDPGDPDLWYVKDNTGDLVGTINRTGPDEWRNSPTWEAGLPPGRVRLGPFATKDAALGGVYSNP